MTRRAMCMHEATHAVVARHFGIEVTEVSVEGTTTSWDLTEYLYGVPVGTVLPGAYTHIALSEYLRDREGVLVAMAAPAFVRTLDPDTDAYAEMEAALAFQTAEKEGLDCDRVADIARDLARGLNQDIHTLAALLEEHGIVHFNDEGPLAGPLSDTKGSGERRRALSNQEGT